MQNNKPTLLITGAGGFLGSNACLDLCRDYRVVGLVHVRSGPPSISQYRADLTQPGSPEQILDEIHPDAVLHIAAVADAAACARDPQGSERMNVKVPEALAAASADRNISFVFTSTDLVFDGEHAPCDETVPTDPLSLYGQQKAEAEQRILAVHPAAAVCRMPLMYGPAPTGAERFFQEWMHALRDGRGVQAFTDEIRTPVSARDALQGLRLALEKGVSGILHLGGPEPISRYAFGRLMADVWGFDPDSVQPVSLKDVTFQVPRPRNVSLDSRRAFALGYQPAPVREAFDALKQDGLL